MLKAEFQQMPPRAFVEQIASPLMKVYMFLWDRRDKKNNVSMDWKELSGYYNKNSFRTNIRKLVETGLVSYVDDELRFSVELVNWDHFE